MFPTSDRTARLGLLVDRANLATRLLATRSLRGAATFGRSAITARRAERLWVAYRDSYATDRAKTVFAGDPL